MSGRLRTQSRLAMLLAIAALFVIATNAVAEWRDVGTVEDGSFVVRVFELSGDNGEVQARVIVRPWVGLGGTLAKALWYVRATDGSQHVFGTDVRLVGVGPGHVELLHKEGNVDTAGTMWSLFKDRIALHLTLELEGDKPATLLRYSFAGSSGILSVSGFYPVLIRVRPSTVESGVAAEPWLT